VGLLCAFGWSTVGLYIGTLLSISIGLILRSVVKKISMGTLKTSIDDLMGKPPPCREKRAPERDGKATIDWIVPSKRMLWFFFGLYACYAVGAVPG
jgi:hypothetical protein